VVLTAISLNIQVDMRGFFIYLLMCVAALQRGDAEMSNKLWRVVRSCVELGDKNPLVQIHDQGAGGNCNVVKEIIYPLGGEVDVRAVKVS